MTPADNPGKHPMHYVLYQNQVWVSRQSLVAWLDNEIAACDELLAIFGRQHGGRWAARRDGFEFLKEQLGKLDPNTGECLG